MGFGPRTRAASEVPRIRSWPDDDGAPALQGFAGYKAGMTHVVMVNDEANSPREGMEESVPVTVVETPPMRAVAVRAYEDTPYGKRPLTELWTDEIHEDLAPEPDDVVIQKPRASAFFDTHLANLLHHEGVDTLVVAGTNTGGCVRATVVDSHSSNFRTVVPPECVAGASTVVHEVTLFDLDMRYADVTPLDDVLDRIAATD